MSSAPIIICQKCKSFRVRELPQETKQFLRENTLKNLREIIRARQLVHYMCEKCGHHFEVADANAYLQENPPDILHRCFECDQPTVELIERNVRSWPGPQEKIADLYKCSSCGYQFHYITKGDPGSLYN